MALLDGAEEYHVFFYSETRSNERGEPDRVWFRFPVQPEDRARSELIRTLGVGECCLPADTYTVVMYAARRDQDGEKQVGDSFVIHSFVYERPVLETCELKKIKLDAFWYAHQNAVRLSAYSAEAEFTKAGMPSLCTLTDVYTDRNLVYALTEGPKAGRTYYAAIEISSKDYGTDFTVDPARITMDWLVTDKSGETAVELRWDHMQKYSFGCRVIFSMTFPVKNRAEVTAVRLQDAYVEPRAGDYRIVLNEEPEILVSPALSRAYSFSSLVQDIHNTRPPEHDPMGGEQYYFRMRVSATSADDFIDCSKLTAEQCEISLAGYHVAFVLAEQDGVWFSARIWQPPISGTVSILHPTEEVFVSDRLDLSTFHIPEPYKIQWQYCAPSGEDFMDIPGASANYYKVKHDQANGKIRVVITADGYEGRIISDDLDILPQTELKGSLTFYGSAYVRSEIKATRDGTLNELYYRVPEGSFRYRWQISPDGVGDWTDIPNAEDEGYTPVFADYLKYIRVFVTVTGYQGAVISPPVQVLRMSNDKTPAKPELTTAAPYTSVTVTNANTTQEYLLTYSDDTPENWAGARFVSEDGPLTLPCESGRVAYVYTRFRGKESTEPGSVVLRSMLLVGESTSLKGISLDKEKLVVVQGGAFELNLVTDPADYDDWTGRTVTWTVEGGGVRLMESAAGLKQVPLGEPVTNRTVYVFGTKQVYETTITVTMKYGAYTYSASCKAEVSDSSGKFKVHQLNFGNEGILQPGYVMAIGFTPSPANGQYGTLSFEQTDGPESNVSITDQGNHTVLVSVPEDTPQGHYEYRVKTDGEDTSIPSVLRFFVTRSSAVVTLDANNGKDEQFRYLQGIGSAFILPELPGDFTYPSGKVFAGWELGSVGDSFIVTEDVVIRALWEEHEHRLREIPSEAPSCTEDGHREGYVCESCGRIFDDPWGNTELSMYEVIIPALGHDWSEWTDAEPSEGLPQGTKIRTCSRCGALESQRPDEPKPLSPFTDVQPGAYYEQPVAWAAAHDPQITAGTSNTTFSPNDTCTRAQVVTFLWRANGQPEPTRTSNPFTDVPADAYYYKAVLWAVEHGVTAGTSETTFSPNQGCTRGQVVTFLWRAAGQPEPKTTENPFADVKEGAYYYKAVLWAVENKITAGLSAASFGPDKTCTRGQIVTFLYRSDHLK